MAGYDYKRVRETANRMITKYGRAARLERGGVQRPVTVAMINYDTQNRDLESTLEQDAIMSAKNLTQDPDAEQDVLVLGATEKFIAPFSRWKITKPPKKLDPAGTVVYWELKVQQ
jgi:hypothetical protein